MYSYGGRHYHLAMFVIFDFDGVIIDTFPAIEAAVQNVHSFLNIDAPAYNEIIAWSGPSIEASSMRLQQQLGFDEQTRRRIGEIYFNSVVELSPAMARPFPGIIELLNELNNSNIPIALATMKTHAEMNAMEKPLPSLECFDHVYAPDTPSQQGGKAELVREATEALRKRGADDPGFMIGDRASDISAGKESGLQTIAVTWGAGTKEELEPALPDQWVHTTEDLRDALISRI